MCPLFRSDNKCCCDALQSCTSEQVACASCGQSLASCCGLLHVADVADHVGAVDCLVHAAKQSMHLVISEGPAHLLASNTLVQCNFPQGLIALNDLRCPLNNFLAIGWPASTYSR